MALNMGVAPGAPSTLTGELLIQARNSGQGITFIKSGSEETFTSVNQLAANAAGLLLQLQHAGMQPGDELVLQEEDNEKILTAFWAALLGGLLPVPLAVGGKEEHWRKLFRVWGGLRRPYLYTSKAHLERLHQHQHLAVDENCPASFEGRFILSDNPVQQADPEQIKHRAQPGDVAFIQYSSGSTGNPKGVELTHANLLANTADLASRLQLQPGGRTLSWIPLTHDMGMIAFHLTSILAGCTQYIMPTPLFIRRPLLWMDKVHTHRPQVLYSPNFGYQYFLDALNGKDMPHWDLSAVRIIVNGAEPISAALCRQFQHRLQPCGLAPHVIQPGYGLAEASVCVSLNAPGTPLNEVWVQRSSLQPGKVLEIHDEPFAPDTVSFVNTGPAASQCSIRIAGDNDNILPPGFQGHIQVKGANVTAGYYRNPQASAGLFTTDGWLRTGDLGFMLPNRQLVVTGRAKNMIIFQGQNYYPHDIERLLLAVPGLTMGKLVVCGVPGSSTQNEQLLVFVHGRHGGEQFEQLETDIVNCLSAKLDLVPDAVIPVREIPKTTSGKVQHHLLVSRYLAGEYQSALNEVKAARVAKLLESWRHMTPEQVTGQLEQWVLHAAANLLKTDASVLDARRPLTDQGLRSVLAVQLAAKVRRQFNLEVPPGILYKYPSAAAMAGFLAGVLNLTPQEATHTPDVEPGGDDRLLKKISSLTDEEIEKLMNEEFSAIT